MLLDVFIDHIVHAILKQVDFLDILHLVKMDADDILKDRFAVFGRKLVFKQKPVYFSEDFIPSVAIHLFLHYLVVYNNSPLRTETQYRRAEDVARSFSLRRTPLFRVIAVMEPFNPLNVLVSFPHGIAVFDNGLAPVFMNPAFRETFGVAAGAAPNAPELFAGRAPEVTGHIERLFREGMSYHNHDFPLAGGTEKRTIALAVHTIDYGRAATGACVVAQDTTGKNELDREFEKEEKMAMLSMITAGLAHEIKNPLSGIRGAAQLIGKEHGALAEYCSLIINETDRINSLVTELMDMGRGRKPQMEKTNIHQLLDDVILLQRAVFKRKKIEAVRDYDPSLPPVSIDPGRIKQTILNLVKNAVEAVGGGGVLRIRTRTALDPTATANPRQKKVMMMAVEIVDDGKGLTPEAAKNLFTPFNTTKTHGTGLGLVLSLKIARDHGGSLTLQNNPAGRGATARLLLPLG